MSLIIKNMLNADVYQHSVGNIELIETHISWVVLTGDYAYKIKKPVNFGFLDFSTLEKRKKYCEQELRLNRRLAPNIYLDVISISGTIEKPVISRGNSVTQAVNKDVIEYAVKMRQFPQAAQLDNMLKAGELRDKHIDGIASMIASFHQSAAVATADTPFGLPEMVFKPVVENFEQIIDNSKSNAYDANLDQIKQWSIAEFKRLKPILIQRKQDGFIRECHGDMHLRNLIWLENKAVAFDCIEFDANLRWIDVISEIAFLMMDLQDHQQPQLANRLLNAYLEKIGDYGGIRVLSFYLCYRAMVRAKVEILRIAQIPDGSKVEHSIEYQTYIELALQYIKPIKQQLIIMRGLSASGKSTVSQHVIEQTGAIRIRSDVERKRLFGISLIEVEIDAQLNEKQLQHSKHNINQGIYAPQASVQTYNKLLDLASGIIDAGHSVLVDAAFLNKHQREPFQKMAKSRGVSFIIIEVTASYDVLRERILARKNDVSDADLSVLENQISYWQPLAEDEKSNSICVDTEKPLDINSILASIKGF